MQQKDAGHRAGTFLRDGFVRTFPKVRNWNTIYWEMEEGSKYWHLGINPWTRTIFHEGINHKPFN